MLSVEELRKYNKERKKLKLEPYNKILDIICNKIKETSIIVGNNYCLYQVPEVIFGYSLYDIDDCCKWLKKHILKLGIDKVEIIEKNILVIKWNH